MLRDMGLNTIETCAPDSYPPLPSTPSRPQTLTMVLRSHSLRLSASARSARYVPWFLHEPVPGTFVVDGDLDLVAFLNTAHRLGLFVILRPGVCALAHTSSPASPAWLCSYLASWARVRVHSALLQWAPPRHSLGAV
jgi:hypothetical protein